jgi:hypothetical protein
MSIERLSVWDEVDEFLTSTPSPEQIIEFRPSEAMQARLQQLVEAKRNGTLTADGRAELDQHLAVENFMRRLKNKALAKIEPHQIPIFRFWYAPSFEPIIAWTILAEGFVYDPTDRFFSKPEKTMVRRTIGGKYTSFSRFASEELREDSSRKGVRVDNYCLKPHEFDSLNLYRKFSFQVITTDSLSGLDGYYFGMQMLWGMETFQIEWWCEGPEGWREIIDWALQTTRFLSKRLDRLETEFKDINQLHPPDYKIWTRLD